MLTEHFVEAERGRQSVRVGVDEAQLQRAVVALRVMAPNAIRPIEELLRQQANGRAVHDSGRAARRGNTIPCAGRSR
ncbi:MAG: hypothetical protein ACR2RB_13625, partial [Gammaproteobacteria bacterium]